MSATLPNRRRWYLLPWIIVAVLGVVVAAGSLLWHREQKLARIPDIPEPFDIAAFVAEDVPDEENAYFDYVAALGLIRPFAGTNEVKWGFVDQRPQSVPPDIAAWLATNRPALDRWFEATAKSSTQAANLSNIGPADAARIDSVIHDFRPLFELVSAEGRRLTLEGRLRDALDCHIAHLRASRHMTNRCVYLDWSMATAWHHQAAGELVEWSETPALTQDELLSARERVRASYDLQAPFSEVLKVEFVLLNDRYDHLQGYLQNQRDLVAKRYPHLRDEVPSDFKVWIEHEPDVSRRLIKLMTANRLAPVDQPPRSRPPLLPDGTFLFDVTPATGVAGSEIAQLVDGRLLIRSGKSNLLQSIDIQRMLPIFLDTVLALQAWRRETGEFPYELDQLVAAGLLSSAPDDLMAPSPQALRYRRDPDNPQWATLWSVGENGVDDGGSPESFYDGAVIGGWEFSSFLVHRGITCAGCRNGDMLI
jgi:hypothetical protein